MHGRHGWYGWLLAAVALALVGAELATAQSPVDSGLQGRVLRRSDGALFVVRDGLRYPLRPASLSDDQIEAIPLGGVIVERLEQLLPSSDLGTLPTFGSAGGELAGGGASAPGTGAAPGPAAAASAARATPTVPPSPTAAASGVRAARVTGGAPVAELAAGAPTVEQALPQPPAAAPNPAGGYPAVDTSPAPGGYAPPGYAAVGPAAGPQSADRTTMAAPLAPLAQVPVYFQADFYRPFGGWTLAQLQTTTGSSSSSSSSANTAPTPMASDWRTLNGMLINDGTRARSAIFPPFQVPTTDYAIEADVQRPRSGDFGLLVRRGDGPGYRLTVNSSLTLRQDGDQIGKRDFDAGTAWHLYRLEARGNALRVFVDGMVMIETTDNRSLTGRLAGIYTDSTQINVRSLRITAPMP